MSPYISRVRRHTLTYKDTGVFGMYNDQYTFDSYSYVYGILVQVYKIRIFSWHTLTYTDHDTDLTHHVTSLHFPYTTLVY